MPAAISEPSNLFNIFQKIRLSKCLIGQHASLVRAITIMCYGLYYQTVYIYICGVALYRTPWFCLRPVVQQAILLTGKVCHQGIINNTGTETFVNVPKYAKLVRRECKLLFSSTQKTHCLIVVNQLCFGQFAAVYLEIGAFRRIYNKLVNIHSHDFGKGAAVFVSYRFIYFHAFILKCKTTGVESTSQTLTVIQSKGTGKQLFKNLYHCQHPKKIWSSFYS